MVQNSLSKLASIIVFILFISPVFADTLSIEDFEAVNDWTFGDDIGVFGTTSAKKTEGTYSGIATVDATGTGTGFIKKTYGSDQDFSSYAFVNFSIWLDESEIAYDDTMRITMHSSDSGDCNKDYVKADTTSQAWNTFQLNITKSTDWDTFTCDFSKIDYIDILIYTEDSTPDWYVYFDNFVLESIITDSCTPPTSGDWKIIDGDECIFNSTKTITGNLNISSGALQIQDSGTLTISGGYIYIYSGSNITMLSGGQING